MQEEWRPTFIRPERYQVSNLGRVRTVYDDGRTVVKKLSVDRSRGGYLLASLLVKTARPQKTKVVRVHRLVALAFLDGEGSLVRHIDGDPTNNRVDNLRWGTDKENAQDTLRHGRHHYASAETCVNNHPWDEANTYFALGRRHCRRCNADAQARRKARRAGVE